MAGWVLGTCSNGEASHRFQQVPSAFAISFPVFQGENEAGSRELAQFPILKPFLA